MTSSVRRARPSPRPRARSAAPSTSSATSAPPVGGSEETYCPARTPDTTIFTRAEPIGRRRPHHAMELPDRHPGVEDRPGAGRRQHRRPQAGRAHPAVGDPPGERADGRRPAGRRAQRRAWPGIRRRRRAGSRPPRRRLVVHRLDRVGLGLHEISPPAVRGYSSRWVARTRYLVLDDADAAPRRTGGRRRRLRADRPGLHGHVPRVSCTPGVRDAFVAALTAAAARATWSATASLEGTAMGPVVERSPARHGSRGRRTRLALTAA